MNICCQMMSDDINYDALNDVIQRAFVERKMEGLHFSCLDYTADDIKKKIEQGAKCIVAIDKEVSDNDIVGTVMITLRSDRKGLLYAYHSNLAVIPEYKGKGIANMLFSEFKKFAISNGCVYILSNTAVGASSSVKWHLKIGFKKIGLRAWESTNFYSYAFVLPLQFHWLWSNPISRYFIYVYSFIKCRFFGKRKRKY